MSSYLDLTVLLTVYRRKNLRAQLAAILNQEQRPARIVVFQNGQYQKLPTRLLRKTGIDWVINSSNTGYFGRFAWLLNADTEFVCVLDDDIIPGAQCLQNYLAQAQQLDAIIGGNGRIARTNRYLGDLVQPPDTGNRREATLVDFVGHMWVFERRLLADMFSIPPITTQTGEDMHLCFSAKKLSGTKAFVAQQNEVTQSCDVTENGLSSDEFASHRSTPKPLRESVERHFAALGVQFITPEEQQKHSVPILFP